MSAVYRAWHATLPPDKQTRPNLDENGILEQVEAAHVIGGDAIPHFRECLRLRHWIAHGRYWAKPIEAEQLDPDEVFIRCDVLLQALPH